MKCTLLLILSLLQILFSRLKAKWSNNTVAQLIRISGVYSLCLPINIYHQHQIATLPYTKILASETNVKTKRRIYERQAANNFRECDAV